VHRLEHVGTSRGLEPLDEHLVRRRQEDKQHAARKKQV
jgi:hypothetical protein